jgi:hypothetical protein
MKFLKKSTQFFRLLEALSGDHPESKRMKGVYPGFEEELDGDYVKSEMKSAGESGYKGPSSYQTSQKEDRNEDFVEDWDYENDPRHKICGMRIELYPTRYTTDYGRRDYLKTEMDSIKKLMQGIQNAALKNGLEPRKYNWMPVNEIEIPIPNQPLGYIREEPEVEGLFQDLKKQFREKRSGTDYINKITMRVKYFGNREDGVLDDVFFFIVD